VQRDVWVIVQVVHGHFGPRGAEWIAGIDVFQRKESAMKVKRYLVPVCLAMAIGLTIIHSGGARATSAHHALAKKGGNPEAVVQKYFGILNAGMKSGDFSALATVYASDATLTQNTPAGVTNVYHGLTQITGFYQATYARLKGFQWTQDAMRRLSGTVVLSYEHAGSPPQSVPGRCSHLFVVKGNKIQSLDWTTFYGGQP
jgi:hypothetical protein